MPETMPGETDPPAAGATALGGQPSYRRSVLFLCLTTFCFWAALYVYVPVLPVYAQSLGASLSMVGVVVAAYAVPQLLIRIPLGVWFDTLRRRKPVVAAGVAMTSVGALGLALAPDPWFLTAARVVTGVGAASWVALTVYFASYHRDTGRAIGVITFVNSAALVAASLVGGIVAETWGFKYTFFAGALLGLMGVAALIPAREPVVEPAAQASWGVFARVATRPLLMLVSLLSILSHFANFASVFGFVPVYAAGIGASKLDLGIMTMLALASSAVAALLVEPVARRRGSRFVIVFGSVLMCAMAAAVPFIHRVPLLGANQVVYGLGRGMLQTSFLSLAIKRVAPQQRATAMGVYQALYSIGMLLGPLVSGFLADRQGLAMVFYLSASLCLAIGGLAFLPALSRKSVSHGSPPAVSGQA